MLNLLQFLKKPYLYLLLVRYLLAIYMLPYALTKILRTQFVLGHELLLVPLEKLSGKAWAWAFLGRSAWFEVLLGFFELIPALLLFFRRTTFLGALLMLPVTLNVFLINYALNLWDGTKLIATILLVLNLLIFALQWKRVQNLISVILAKTQQLRFNRTEWLVNIVIIVSGIIYFGSELFSYRQNQQNELIGDWLNNHPIEWVQQSKKLNDSTVLNENTKVNFGQFGTYIEKGGSEVPPNTYKIDAGNNTIKFTYQYNNQSFSCNYKLSGDTLIIERLADEKNPKRLTRIFTKRVMNTEQDM
jgi:hypothetical protein